MPRTRHILSVYVYDTLNNRYGFSISVQPEIDCTTFHSFFSWNVWKKNFFKIFKSWQVCDWLAKWIIMLGFMDLRWPRVFRRSSVGLVLFYFSSVLPISLRIILLALEQLYYCPISIGTTMNNMRKNHTNPLKTDNIITTKQSIGEWIGNFTPHSTGHVVTYSCGGQS